MFFTENFIFSGLPYNFNKMDSDKVFASDSDIGSDIGSVMHYNGYAFYVNGKATIIDKRTGEGVKTRVCHLSYLIMYECALVVRLPLFLFVLI